MIPGGESTTITLAIKRENLAEPIRELAARGAPVLGTCAGLIMLDSEHLALMDITARRNAFGRQIHSFEAGGRHRVPGRRRRCTRSSSARHGSSSGPAVEVLGSVDGHPVAARQGELFAVAFHAELGTDTRLHAAFAERVRA